VSSSWKSVSVFVSSTFNDMHAERDYLIKRVFPELKEWCEQRKLRLIDIDLRWGITEADATNKNVVKVCLNRIDECRPFFLCFLGQRRGWVPGKKDIAKDTYDTFPDIKQYIGDASVTEMEILHAVIDPMNKKKKADRAFFYLRDPSYLDQIPKEPKFIRNIYTNDGIADPIDQARANEQLRAWREEKIPETGRFVHHYTATWNPDERTPELALPLRCPSRETENQLRWVMRWQELGVNPTHFNLSDEIIREEALHKNEEITKGRLGSFICGDKDLADVILNDLKSAIEENFPDQMVIVNETPLQIELNQQEQFLELNCTGFIEREGDFDAINEYIESGSQDLFVITAPGGMGKTMFLANWIRKFQQRSLTPIFYRFIGASNGSSTVDPVLRSLLQEMEERELLSDEIPFDSIELRNKLPDLLQSIGSKSNIVIVIDALNQLANGLKDLYWLPRKLPSGIKIIVSFKPEKGESEIFAIQLQTELPDTFTSIHPFESGDDRKKIVVAYLDQYFKQLDDSLIQALIETPGAINPLFLKVVLSEIRIYGSFENLDDKIRNDFGKTPVDAFAGMLTRLEKDPTYSLISMQQTVPLLFGLLSHSRRGLSELELVNLFIQEINCTEEAARDSIRLLVRQVRLFFSMMEGRHDFFYESFKEAAIKRYERERDEGISVEMYKLLSEGWHLKIADYFFNLAGSEKQKEWNKIPMRALSELPYQIVHIGDCQTAERLFCDLTFIEASITHGLFDQLLGDIDLISFKDIQNIKTVHNSMLLSSAAIRKRPHLSLQTLINRIRNEPIGSTLLDHLKYAEDCMDKRGIWLCSLTSFGSDRLIKNIIAISPHNMHLYVRNEQNAIECYDMNSYRLIARYGPFSEQNPVHIIIHPVSGRIIWMDSFGNIYDGFNSTKFHVRTRYFCFSFFGSGIIGVDTENRLIFYNLETQSKKILADSINTTSAKIFTNSNCRSSVIVSGDRIPSQRIFIVQIQGDNFSIKEWPVLDSPVTSACIDDNGSTVLFAARNRQLKIFNISDQSILQEISFRVVQGKPVRGIVQQCRMTSIFHNSYAIIATNEGELLVWDCSSNVIKKRGYYRSIREYRSLEGFEVVPKTGKFIVATDEKIQFLDLDGTGEFKITTPVTDCSISQDGWLILVDNAMKCVTWFKNGQQKYDYLIPNYEPTSVAACNYNGTAFIGYNNGSVVRIQPDREVEMEDAVDLFDQSVIKILNFDDKRVLVASARGNLKIVRFQPARVLRDIKPFGIAREEQYVVRLGSGDDILGCGLSNIGSFQYTIFVIRHNDSRETVLETSDRVHGIAASHDGRAIFIAVNEKVCRFKKVHWRWIQDAQRSADVLHLIMCAQNLLGVIVRENSVSYLELWSMTGDRMETVISMELPYECTSICSNGNVIAIGAVDGRHCIVNIKKGENNEVLST